MLFHEAVVAEVKAMPKEHVQAALRGLVRRGLIRPDQPLFSGERAYRFRHLLIRDAAYDSIPKAARAVLHEGYADWLERRSGGRALEFEEILGYHLEQAFRYRSELGRVDEAAVDLARRAGRRLGVAGRRALARGDTPAAINLASRAASLLPPDDPMRVHVIPGVRTVQGHGGELAWADTLLRDAIATGGAGAGLAAPHGRLDDLEEALLGPGPAHLALRRLPAGSTSWAARRSCSQRAVSGWEEFDGHSPHRPWIDAVKLSCPQCGAVASRVPDVGNVWLDAGIVPYSTLGYRHDRATWAQWFPADFITESFPGQFRNWFYALLTMSTVLEDREPFRTVLGHALVRDDQGREMHKSWGNAIEFNEAAERVGASVMRWMFATANPEQNLNFGYGLADEVKRRLLTLWNVYAFFCNYARLDGFNPLAATTAIEPAARPALDRWILGQLNALVEETTRRYDDFDPAGAGRRLEEFVDDLSNWYIRRGRQRYWKSEADADRSAAYLTLWEVLTTLSKLLAPSMPFLAEAMYQNLVRRVDPQAPPSVHHCRWPAADAGLIDPELRRGDGPGAPGGRAGAGRAHPQGAHPGPAAPPGAPGAGEEPGRAGAPDGLSEQVLEELNVKRLEVVDDTSQLLSYRIKPNFRLLGPLFGPKLNAVVRALQSADAAELARHHAAGEAVTVVVEGRQVEVPAEDFEVEVTDAPGFAVVEEGGYLVALDTRAHAGAGGRRAGAGAGAPPELDAQGRRLPPGRPHRHLLPGGRAPLTPLRAVRGGDPPGDPLLAPGARHGPGRRAGGLPATAHAEQVRLDGRVVTLSVQRAGSPRLATSGAGRGEGRGAVPVQHVRQHLGAEDESAGGAAQERDIDRARAAGLPVGLAPRFLGGHLAQAVGAVVSALSVRRRGRLCRCDDHHRECSMRSYYLLYARRVPFRRLDAGRVPPNRRTPEWRAGCEGVTAPSTPPARRRPGCGAARPRPGLSRHRRHRRVRRPVLIEGPWWASASACGSACG